MPPLGVDYFALPEKGGLKRDSQSISSHYMPGALDKNLLSNALTLHATARRHDDQLDVRARVVNDLTGHHVPTDSPLRHVILLVTVTQQDGSDATLISGTTLPEWCGVGDPARGCYSGLPGKVFAKVLEEEWTRVAPTGAYWNPTRILEDTRIAAYGQDTSSYHFKVIRSGPVKVDVVLLYRRAYKELMDVKGWDFPDIVMEQKTLTVAAGRGKRNKNLKQRYPLTAATATIHPNEPKMGFSLDL